jgi:mono/diheme cytochrome c family protein
MTISSMPCGLLLAGASLLCLNPIVSTQQPSAQPAKVDFRRDVYPILKGHCFPCHQGSDASSGYRLDLREEILGETNGHPMVKLGRSDESRLIALVTGAVKNKVMPLKGKRLTEPQILKLRAWIDQGLSWDHELLPTLVASTKHWSFKPVVMPAIPKVKNAGWVRNPIDSFIAARREAQGVTPAPEAPRRVLIRRLALDLTGLPPTLEEIDGFLADTKPQAYERLVERHLASPHHGERWARHWLDVARWAESEGYESNHPRPYAWRYRDYVAASFNSGKPFDRFVREQVAGDEMLPYRDEHLIATGFLGAARLSSNEEDQGRQRNDMLVDIVNATSSAFLGLTLHCAQCHSHKFDPISARDYYRFQGFWVKGQLANLALRDEGLVAEYNRVKPAEYDPAVKLQRAFFEGARTLLIDKAKKSLTLEQRAVLTMPPEQRTPAQEQLARAADLKFQFTPNQIENAIPADDRKLYGELKKKIAALEKKMPDRPQTFGFYSPATSPTAIDVLPMKGFYPLPYRPAQLASARPYLLVAGEIERRGSAVEVGWPALFGSMPKGATDNKPRLALADWLSDPRHPLTARVFVNRLWQYHFGRGLVSTSSDFGIKGQPPTHPELLDWLAAEFVRSGWDVKHMHRLIVGSNTYRQSSVPHAANARLDPDNRFHWRWQPRRLEAEAIRDSLLAVSGELDRKVGGPSDTDATKSVRRSLYLFQRRGSMPAFLSLFDGPSAVLESCSGRHVSTVAMQALYLLNNEFSINRARKFAGRVASVAGEDRDRRIDTAFLLALGRPPENGERAASRRVFEGQTDPEDALVLFCQALTNVNEFVYLE